MVRAVYGSYGEVPYGPASSILWISHGAPKPAGPNPAAGPPAPGRAGLDGHRRRRHPRPGGPPAAARPQLSRHQPGAQADGAAGPAAAPPGRHRRRASAVRVPGLAASDRTAGHFDIDFSSTIQDPSPSGLTQGWSCDGGNQRGALLQPEGGLPDRARHRPAATMRAECLAGRPAPDRGRRPGRIHVRARATCSRSTGGSGT